MMLRQTAVDMENSENLLDGETIVYNHGKKYLVGGCCLVISYGISFALGFFSGYNSNICDGSWSFF